MGKRRWILPVAVLLAAVGGMAWILADKRPPEPVYEGKPLQYWLAGYGPPSAGTNSTVDGYGANEAINKLGADAVPSLVRMLERQDSDAKRKITTFLLRIHLLKTVPASANLNWEALNALKTLGPKASNSVPRLISMFKRDHSPFGQTASLSILGAIGPASAAATPLLLQRGICHTNGFVRGDAIYALRRIHPEPGMVVPEFIKCLSDPEPLVRAQAARTLGDYGKDAQAAVPLLLKLYRTEPPRPMVAARASVDGGSTIGTWTTPSTILSSPPDVAKLAGEALTVIDPQTAALEGVKASKGPIR